MGPLEGKNILITRASSQSSSITREIEQKGGRVIHVPLLQFKLKDSVENKHILTKLHDFSWVFLTSSNGVKFFFELLSLYDVKIPRSCKWAVVGEKTAETLESYGVKPDFIPTNYRAVAMVEQFFERVGEPGKILFVRGNRSRKVLPHAFLQQQVFFQTVTVYDTLVVDDEDVLIRKLDQLDALTFTSPSTVEAFMQRIEKRQEEALHIPCFCIGPTTGEAAKSYGFQTVYIPEVYTIKTMIDKMAAHFDKRG
ncbi:uroporphyrinogen-III synthase [Halobacillus shinanisalinarum]|uniref:Uroporphyrinogen-III synthase n=1 Tax=Halobacillus shinanisalinarum TaxID=2932258 RepID=A0ABY4H146_9BACI|nr:uroporphyrinogen-III synthase [Halobacillus shinanisalinarum]UOQ93885.1 uroporphyrinogen-III synthase [Halobacillus shinanisalinarum]